WAIFATAVTLATAHASADEARVVRGARVHLSDVVPALPAEVPDFEIAAAPPPGSSRTIAKGEIIDAADKNGINLRQLKLPLAVRVTSAAKRWSIDELTNAATPTLLNALAPGIAVKRAKATSTTVTSPSATISAVRVPKLPRREGEYLTTAMIEIS